MKKYILLAFVLVIGLSSCKKDAEFDATKQAALDDAAIQTYITAHSIVAVKDPTGLYYQVITPGTGSYPTVSSLITVNYTGKLLDGTVFDFGTINNAALSGFITGWKVGIPHINTGGRLLLLVPSGMAYGNAANGSIPKNSPLVFTIDLTGFHN